METDKSLLIAAQQRILRCWAAQRAAITRGIRRAGYVAYAYVPSDGAPPTGPWIIPVPVWGKMQSEAANRGDRLEALLCSGPSPEHNYASAFDKADAIMFTRYSNYYRVKSLFLDRFPY